MADEVGAPDGVTGGPVTEGPVTDESVTGELDGVRVVREGPIVRVTLCSPENRNAQTPATWRRLASIERIVDQDVRAVILDADGPSFCAGLDRRMFTADAGAQSLLSIADLDVDGQDRFIRQAQSAFTWWSEVPAITVALVNGHAIGAGFQLALACDWILAADDARFAMRETSLGLVPDLGGTSHLVARVGYSRALEICATGRFVEADEAVRTNLALTSAPAGDLRRLADDLLAPVLAAMPHAVAEVKSLLRAASSTGDPNRSAQLARERSAQIRRLAALRLAFGG